MPTKYATMTKESHPLLYKQYDHANNERKFETLTPGMKKDKYWWICEIKLEGCGICVHRWLATVKSRAINGSGCPFCVGIGPAKQICVHASVFGQHPELMPEWKSDRDPKTVAVGCNELFPFECPKFNCAFNCPHIYESTIGHRLQKKTGCPYCGTKIDKVCIHNSFAYLYPEIYAEWDNEANEEIDPFTLGDGSGHPSAWRCKKGHKYYQPVRVRVQGLGCPTCNANKNKACVALVKYFLHHELKFKPEQTFGDLKFRSLLRYDYLINYPKLKYPIIIESDGPFHFHQQYYLQTPPLILPGELTKYYCDTIKNDYCKKNSFHFLRFAYTEIYRIPEMLDYMFNQCIQHESDGKTCISMIPKQMYIDLDEFMTHPSYASFKSRIITDGHGWLKNEDLNIRYRPMMQKYVVNSNGNYTLIPVRSSLPMDIDDYESDDEKSDADEEKNNTVKNNKRKRHDDEKDNEDVFSSTSSSSSSYWSSLLPSSPLLISPSSSSLSSSLASPLSSSPSSFSSSQLSSSDSVCPSHSPPSISSLSSASPLLSTPSPLSAFI